MTDQPKQRPNLDDYIDVATRIADFRERYPDGCLQPFKPWEQALVTGYDKNGDQVSQCFIVYTAAAYRTPDDPRPGIGVAWEVFPGRTPYTRGSELMNAETSAWGRAIIAVGASDSKLGIASREEVRNRAEEQAIPPAYGNWPEDEKREHMALRRGAAGRLDKAGQDAKARAAVQEDVWIDQPPGLLPVGDPEDRPGSISQAQQKMMHAKFKALGIEDRAERLANTQLVIGREVLTSSQLSFTEAARLLEALEEKARVKHG